MPIRSVVVAEFENVAKEQGKTLALLFDELMLLETGLDSLCFAIIVVRLEESLGLDPFQTAADGQVPVTFGQFVKFYENAAAA